MRADGCVSGHTSDASMRLQKHLIGAFPTHAAWARGATICSTDGVKFTDFIGTDSVLGYANDGISQALSRQIQRGSIFSIPPQLEVEAAEKLKELVPHIDVVRFFKSRKAALDFAISSARAFKPNRSPMVLEPHYFSQATLNELFSSYKRAGDAIIFDESDSTFRVPKYTLSEHFGVIPDFIILGGALASGLPLFAVGGKLSSMAVDDGLDSDPYTLDTMALCSFIATASILQTRYSLKDLWDEALSFQKEFNKLWPKVQLVGQMPTLLQLAGDKEALVSFKRDCAISGILFRDTVKFSFPLASEWKQALTILKPIVMRLKTRGLH